MYGGQISLAIGVFAALVGTTVGTLMGSIAGYYGRMVDNVIMRVTDVFFSIPSLPLVDHPKLVLKSAIPVMILVIGLLSWMSTARIVRGTVLSIREREFTTAARAIGVRDARIMARHILPNALAPIIVGATLGVGGAIIAESSLSFLGLGVQVPTPQLGEHAAGFAEHDVSAPVADDLPRDGNPHHGVRYQLSRRWAARCARPDVCVIITCILLEWSPFSKVYSISTLLKGHSLSA